MISSYRDALQYLYENLPMFQRIGPVAIRKDLTNTLALCQALGNPQRKFRSVHVAGTNGKGSTCHMLASVLQAAGYKTGLYTSPHLKEFTERIRISGEEISRDFVLDFVNRIQPQIEKIKPSFFEITVAMAFDYFAAQKVDVAVIEVGLGGRLDSTNVITPMLSVITNISWDHKDLLGDTLPAIAGEKAGIIKPKIPVVISERQEEVQSVFEEKASRENAPVFFASDEYAAALHPGAGTVDIFRNAEPVLRGVRFPLGGAYQRRNIPGVMKALELLRRDFDIDEKDIRDGLECVVTSTGLRGRWQVLKRKPLVICDTAHNFDGVQEVMRQVAEQPRRGLFIVWGMVKDKDPSPVLALLPKEAVYYFCQARIPRALDAYLLKEEAARFGLRGEVVPDVRTAGRTALGQAGPDDFIFIGGSTYVVAETDL